MSSLRIARAALRARPAAIARPIQRRGYAEVANDKIKLSLALPHQSIYKSQDVVQVNLPAETGDMGVLANHVASIEQLKPGLVEIIEEQGGSKQFFLSGGFAVVQPNSVLSINAVEGYPLEDFSAEAVRNQIGEAQKIASGSGSEADIAEAKIELEVLESLQAALKKASLPADIPDYEEEHHDIERESISRRRSTNILASTPRHAEPLDIHLQTADDSSAQASITKGPPAAIGEPKPIDEPDSAAKVVRYLSTRSSVPAAETREAKNSELHLQPEGRRAKPSRDLRRAFEEDQGTSPKRLRRSGSHTASLTESGNSSKEPIDRVAEWTPSTDAKVSRHQFGKSVNVRRRAEEITSRDLGHDGASDLSLSRRSTISDPIPAANIGVEEKYYEIEVLNDVDNRQGYGRRVTQDFGFPGARINSHGTNRTSKPLQDPGNWTKRACGHFSYMGKSEHRDLAQKEMCRQCSTRAAPPEDLPATQRRIRRRALSESSNSTISSSKPSNDDVCHRQRRRRHHSECIPHDKCGDKFAEELGYIIDNILDEHANTLQAVISNIKNSQPSIGQLRRVSGDLVQRCQTNGTCRQRCQASCRPAQPSCLQDDDWLPPCSYAPPKAAEKLNVGSTGQLKPNLNDPRSSLREALQSIPDLVDLINSAADDLGVNLERRPTATDDDMFRNAPYETRSRESVSYRPDLSSEATEDKATDEEPLTEDSWLQQTRKHLTELSEAREQLMNELDSIAGDLDAQLQDQQETQQEDEPFVRPVQRVLGKAPTSLSRTPTLQRNALVKSVQRVLSKTPAILSRRSTWQDEEQVDDTDVKFVQRVLSESSTGRSHKSTWHLDTRHDSNTVQDHYEDDSSVETTQPMLEKIPTGLACVSTGEREESVDAVIEDFEGNQPDHQEEEVIANLVQRVLSRETTAVSGKLTWSRSKPVDPAIEDVPSTIDAGTDYEPADETRDVPGLSQLVEPTSEARYSSQYEKSVDSQSEQQYEARPGQRYDDHGLTSLFVGYSEPIEDLHDQVLEPESRLSLEANGEILTTYQKHISSTLVGRVAVPEKAETVPPVRRMTKQHFAPKAEHRSDAEPQQDTYTEDELNTPVTVLGRSAVSERTDSMPPVRRMTAKDLATEPKQANGDEAAIRRFTIPLSRQSTVRLEYESEISTTPTIIQEEAQDLPSDSEMAQPQAVQCGDTYRRSSIAVSAYEPYLPPDLEVEEPQETQHHATRRKSSFASPPLRVNTTRTFLLDASDHLPNLDTEEPQESQRFTNLRRYSAAALQPLKGSVRTFSRASTVVSSPPEANLLEEPQEVQRVDTAQKSSFTRSKEEETQEIQHPAIRSLSSISSPQPLERVSRTRSVVSPVASLPESSAVGELYAQEELEEVQPVERFARTFSFVQPVVSPPGEPASGLGEVQRTTTHRRSSNPSPPPLKRVARTFSFELPVSSAPDEAFIQKEPHDVQRVTIRRQSTLTSPQPLQRLARTFSSVTPMKNAPDELIAEEEPCEAKRLTTCRQSSFAPSSPNPVEQATRAVSFASSETNLPDELVSQL
ncbi:hypothetical protein G6011_05727 [Alternaria panax]|nr:hypothetical protein G6011_05727 [Alternaria panax]